MFSLLDKLKQGISQHIHNYNNKNNKNSIFIMSHANTIHFCAWLIITTYNSIFLGEPVQEFFPLFDVSLGEEVQALSHLMNYQILFHDVLGRADKPQPVTQLLITGRDVVTAFSFHYLKTQITSQNRGHRGQTWNKLQNLVQREVCAV